MPHIADTSSDIINLHNAIGGGIVVLGFLGFLAGALQVYYHKLAKKGVVLGGIYRIIRHPQYASFAVCGLGLLIVWPRYIVLVTFITMLFIYYVLAIIEEHECEEKFGQSYLDYKHKTNMFFPIRLPFIKSVSGRFNKFTSWSKFAVMFVAYLVVLYAGIESIELVEAKSINSLYKYSNGDSVTVSVTQMPPKRIKAVIGTVMSDKEVQKLIDSKDKDAKFLNYVLPGEWYIPELPMQKRGNGDHFQPADYNRNLYKIIFNKAELRPNYQGKPFLTQVVKRTPIVEVLVDVSNQKVVSIKNPPSSVMYDNIPEAIY
jgi:hypothetical protein